MTGKFIFIFLSVLISTFTLGYLFSVYNIIKNKLLRLFILIFTSYCLSRLISLGADYLDHLERAQIFLELSTLGLIIYFINFSFKKLKFSQLLIITFLYLLSFNSLVDYMIIENKVIYLLLNNISIIPLLLYFAMLLNRENILNKSVKIILFFNILITLIDNIFEVIFLIDIPKDAVIIIGYSCISIYYMKLFTRSLIKKNASEIKPEFNKEFNITKREAEIVNSLCHGLSYKRMAYEMNISLSTVKTHVHNIYRKTQVKSRFDLLQLLRDF